MGAVIEVKYFNSFILKKTNIDIADEIVPGWNGSPGVPQSIGGYPAVPTGDIGVNNWNIEEARILGGYNNTSVDYGVRAYLAEDETNASIRSNSLIYSGIYNSRTGVNNTNVFSVGEEITKSADPANGSIQRLYAEDTNLIIFQESKVSRALIDKDAIYSAEGGGSITNINTTIGTIQPYAGEFGISKDPASFAVYGYRKYFTDKNRNAVLRLSADGITEISNYGMYDYFRDEFNRINVSGAIGELKAGWDVHNKQYVLSSQPSAAVSNANYSTVSFDEGINGWTSFFTFKPDQIFSVKNNFYTVKGNGLYQHYSVLDVDNEPISRGSFYGVTTPTSVSFVFNPSPSSSKVFNTVNYEGSNGWEVPTFNANRSFELIDIISPVLSYTDGAYIGDFGYTYHAGFNRKEGKYFANLVNASSPTDGEIVFGGAMTGVKGYVAHVTISTDTTTDPGGSKELFAVSSEYVESSY